MLFVGSYEPMDHLLQNDILEHTVNGADMIGLFCLTPDDEDLGGVMQL